MTTEPGAGPAVVLCFSFTEGGEQGLLLIPERGANAVPGALPATIQPPIPN